VGAEAAAEAGERGQRQLLAGAGPGVQQGWLASSQPARARSLAAPATPRAVLPVPIHACSGACSAAAAPSACQIPWGDEPCATWPVEVVEGATESSRAGAGSSGLASLTPPRSRREKSGHVTDSLRRRARACAVVGLAKLRCATPGIASSALTSAVMETANDIQLLRRRRNRRRRSRSSRKLNSSTVIIGNSMGAGAAVIAAAEQPNFVRGLVLLGPFVRNGKTNAPQRLMLRVAMARPWAAIAWKAYMPKLYAGQQPSDLDEYRDRVVASLRRPGYATAFSLTTRTGHDPAEARLTDVSQPTLVVMGEQDPDFPDPREEAHWIAQALHAEVVMVPEAGHCLQSQRPDVTTDAVLKFLETMH
jgi:pimeloyl-ACP methyl ester carboxylesterase